MVSDRSGSTCTAPHRASSSKPTPPKKFRVQGWWTSHVCSSSACQGVPTIRDASTQTDSRGRRTSFLTVLVPSKGRRTGGFWSVFSTRLPSPRHGARPTSRDLDGAVVQGSLPGPGRLQTPVLDNQKWFSRNFLPYTPPSYCSSPTFWRVEESLFGVNDAVSAK